MLALPSLPKIEMQIVMRLVIVLWIIREPGGINRARSVIWTESTTPWLVRQLQEFTGTGTIKHQFALNWSRLKYNPSDKSVYYGVNIGLSAEFSSNGTILSLAELKGQIQVVISWSCIHNRSRISLDTNSLSWLTLQSS